MKRYVQSGRQWMSRSLVWGMILLGCLAAAVLAADQDKPEQERLASFKARGAEASLTIYPIALAGRTMRDVGNVVGMLLEKAGMESLEIADTAFERPADTGFADVAEVFGKFVCDAGLKTDYALYGEFVGSPREGVTEVCTLIVDKTGQCVWLDRQKPGAADFDRVQPRNPMSCCVLMVERLRTQLNLPDPLREGTQGGKLAKKWARETGVPDETEQAAIEQRQKTFKLAGASASLAIYPPRLGAQVDAEGAAHLAELLKKDKLVEATAAKEQPQFDIPGAMNEQRVLWDLARQFRAYVRKNPPATEYVLYADYMLKPGTEKTAAAVHLVVCDRAGNWVIVDFQNSHHGDFKSIQPKSRADCDRLVAKRLGGYLR